ncbi:hypothetical protein KKG24_04115 [Patescibacteria group bacterium]|nr:hypothetical protein [Patescibacteria group bacterium]
MIYLIGVNHQLQDGTDRFGSQELLLYVRNFIDKNAITLLAEEWSSDIAKKRGESILRACEDKTKYFQFDLLQSEADKLGVKRNEEIWRELGATEISPGIFSSCDMEKFLQRRREESRKREPEWLKRLSPHLKKGDSVIVCGSDHLSDKNPDGLTGFDVLLNQQGYQAKILKHFDIN